MNKNNEKFTCECSVIHTHVVETVMQKMPESEKLFKLSDLFKSFADGTRLRILWALSISEMCVCDLAALLKMTTSAVSHQLATLRFNNLVRFKKEGKVVYYSLADNHVMHILADGLDHVSE